MQEEVKLTTLRRSSLLYHLLSPWRRRGATLLQVGLESALLPDFFWEAGFDTSALDANAARLAAVAMQTGPRVEYSLGQADHLPFDDSAFDYVVLSHLGLRSNKERKDWTQTVLQEAVRVAGRGVIVLEWNRLAWPTSKEQRKVGVWPLSLIWQMRKACPDGAVTVRTIMPVPQSHKMQLMDEALIDTTMRTGKISTVQTPWAAFLRYIPPILGGHGESLANRINKRALPLPFGSIVGLRLEKSPLLLTPIGPVKLGGVKETSAYATDSIMHRPTQSSQSLSSPPTQQESAPPPRIG